MGERKLCMAGSAPVLYSLFMSQMYMNLHTKARSTLQTYTDITMLLRVCVCVKNTHP